jgi:outer membrane lipoprotein LolB
MRMPRGAMRTVLLAGLLALSAACVTPPVKAPSAENWEQRRAHLQQLEQFAFKGRLAAAINNDGFNASLQWQQRADRSVIDLRAPLGFGSVHIEREPAKFSLQTSRGEKLDGDAALTGLAARLGFSPPLDSLRYWILGVPDPQRPSIETPGVDARNLAALEQDGWHIQYEEYRDAGGVPMPRRAQLTRADARLRLIVDEWTL